MRTIKEVQGGGPETLGFNSAKERSLWSRGVEILSLAGDGELRLGLLIRAYEMVLATDTFAGSFKAAEDQLNDLAMAADSMVVAMRGLRGASMGALFRAGDDEHLRLWNEAGGKQHMPELEELALALDGTIEQAARLSMQGCLIWHFRTEEFTALAALCRKEARHQAELHEQNLGLPSAARYQRDSPSAGLANTCAQIIHSAGGELSQVKEIVRIIAELVTGKPSAARFAERECRVAWKSAQTPE